MSRHGFYLNQKCARAKPYQILLCCPTSTSKYHPYTCRNYNISACSERFDPKVREARVSCSSTRNHLRASTTTPVRGKSCVTRVRSGTQAARRLSKLEEWMNFVFILQEMRVFKSAHLRDTTNQNNNGGGIYGRHDQP